MKNSLPCTACRYCCGECPQELNIPALIRRLGYVLDNEDNELGVRCVAAAVTDYTGKAAADISISAPVPRVSDEHIDALADEILAVRAKLSPEHGGKP